MLYKASPLTRIIETLRFSRVSRWTQCFIGPNCSCTYHSLCLSWLIAKWNNITSYLMKLLQGFHELCVESTPNSGSGMCHAGFLFGFKKRSHHLRKQGTRGSGWEWTKFLYIWQPLASLGLYPLIQQASHKCLLGAEFLSMVFFPILLSILVPVPSVETESSKGRLAYGLSIGMSLSASHSLFFHPVLLHFLWSAWPPLQTAW